MVKFLLTREPDPHAIVEPNTLFHVYDISIGRYVMGIEVLDTNKDNEHVLVTLFHWENEEHKLKGFHFASNEEGRSFLKVYKNSKGRYFIYQKSRIYLP